MASHALPPFLPKRNTDDSYGEVSLVNSFTFCNNNASFVSLLGDSDSDSDLESEEETSGPSIRMNLRQVLGDVLEQLDDDDDFFKGGKL